jgi:predicted permease
MRFERWLYMVPLKWRSIVRPRDVERDLDDEIQYHLEQQVDALVAQGADRDEAWRTVRRNFGGVAMAKERCRDARGVQLIDVLRQDVRYAGRTLRRNPGFATVAVLTLALGIGANTAVFSLVDGILLSRLPYASPEQLVSIKGATYPNGGFAAMREEIRSLDVAAYAEGHSFTLTGGGEPMRLTGSRVSAELFSILGVLPALGRWLQRGEDVSPQDRYVVISHALWASRFHQDRTIIGRSIQLDEVSREVVAVMPASFQFPSPRTQIWVPLGLDARDTTTYWAGDYMPIIGRLRPGAAMTSAQGDVRVFQSRIGARFPWRMPDSWNRDLTVISLQEALVGDVRPQLLILIAGVALVLVIACANVANLSLSRAITREREIVVRTAIGAAPRRIAMQLLTESVVLASIGAVVGLLFATHGLAIMKLVLPPDTPRLADANLNWRVLAFTGLLGVLTGCAFGLVPVLRALRLKLRSTLDAGGRDGRGAVAMPLRSALTIGQIACAVLLVISAGLLVRSLWRLSHTDPGFQAAEVVTARISPTESVCRDSEHCLAFYRAFEAELQGTAGIAGVALINTLPLTGAVAKRSLELERFITPENQTAPLFWMNTITPDYFRVMHIRLVSGRAFTRADLTGHPAAAIVTASTARRFWPGQDPVGLHIRFIGEAGWHQIVGVVSDIRAYDLTRDVPEWITGSIYVPYGPNATMENNRIPSDMTLTLGTTLGPAHVASMIQSAALSAGGEVAVSDVRPMASVLANAMAAPAATASLLVTMAGLALVLGSIGVYGVLSFLVSRRTRDFGIHIALGAQPRDLFWLVFKEGGILCGAGILTGFAGALAATRLMSSELYGISPTDPLTYATVGIVVSLVTMMACYVPTRRAMGMDPLVALRDQ